jgi:hypothetical protein
MINNLLNACSKMSISAFPVRFREIEGYTLKLPLHYSPSTFLENTGHFYFFYSGFCFPYVAFMLIINITESKIQIKHHFLLSYISKENMQNGHMAWHPSVQRRSLSD